MTDLPTITVRTLDHSAYLGLDFGEYVLIPTNRIRFRTPIMHVPEVGVPKEITLAVNEGEMVLIVEADDD